MEMISTAIVLITSFLVCYTIHINWSLKGPFVLPFIGSPEALFYIATLQTHELLDLILERTYGKVVQVCFLGIEEFNIFDAHDGVRVLRECKRPDFLHDASVGIMDYALFAMKTDPVWKLHRQAIQPSFSPQNLRTGAKDICKTVRHLVNIFEKDQGQSKDILHLMTATTMDSLALFAFGESVGALTHPNTETVWSDLSNITLKPTTLRFSVPKIWWGLFNLAPMSPRIVNNRKRIHDYLEGVIERAKNTSDGSVDLKKMNIMNRLLTKQDSGNLSKEEVFGEVLGFFIAGTDTTANTTTFLILELCRNPEIQERLYAELKDTKIDENDEKLVETLNSLPYLHSVVQETQRLHTTIGSTDRESDQTQVILGKSYPPKTRFVVSIRGIHLSKDYWVDPFKFNPDRWTTDKITPAAFMPFGDGPRNCIGQKFAIIEIKLIILALVQNFRFRMDYGSKLEYTSKLTYNVDGFRAFVESRV